MSGKVAKNSASQGTFNIVATPIGNLQDITYRAVQVLGAVDVVLAEDTRHSKPLLNHYGISTPLKSCHQHNEAQLVEWVSEQLAQGKDIALISDAGTPLISDPGYVLLRALREQNANIAVVPGASSVIAALSVAGLPTDRFIFDGFLSSKQGARQAQLERYQQESRTAVLLESSHRITACIEDVVSVLGAQRKIVLARELTKKFETVLSGTADEVLQQLHQDDDQTRGEFVLLLAGVEDLCTDDAQAIETLKILLKELPVKQAAKLASQLLDTRKNELYELALTLQNGDRS